MTKSTTDTKRILFVSSAYDLAKVTEIALALSQVIRRKETPYIINVLVQKAQNLQGIRKPNEHINVIPCELEKMRQLIGVAERKSSPNFGIPYLTPQLVEEYGKDFFEFLKTRTPTPGKFCWAALWKNADCSLIADWPSAYNLFPGDYTLPPRTPSVKIGRLVYEQINPKLYP